MFFAVIVKLLLNVLPYYLEVLFFYLIISKYFMSKARLNRIVFVTQKKTQNVHCWCIETEIILYIDFSTCNININISSGSVFNQPISKYLSQNI